jgi:hypothetical protein
LNIQFAFFLTKDMLYISSLLFITDFYWKILEKN